MPPVAHPNAVTLWKSTSVEAWRTAIEAYDARLDALNRGERLKALDAFVRIELPRRVKSRAEKGVGREILGRDSLKMNTSRWWIGSCREESFVRD